MKIFLQVLCYTINPLMFTNVLKLKQRIIHQKVYESFYLFYLSSHLNLFLKRSNCNYFSNQNKTKKIIKLSQAFLFEFFSELILR